jgi:Icc-related predicted phosphoesterase
MRLILLRLLPIIWLKRGVDIVITHAPPRHIHDAEDPCHRGFIGFRWLMQLFAPRYLIHGHIHAHFSDRSERITPFGRSKVVNTYGHFFFEIDPHRLAH